MNAGSSVTIALLQDVPGSGIRPGYLKLLSAHSPDILALPEYYFVNATDDSVISSSFRSSEILEFLKDLSADLSCILVGGSIVESCNGGFVNRSYILDLGKTIGFYDKIHPFDNEGRGLIRPGTEYRVFKVRGLGLGVLICADVLYPDSFANIRGLRPQMIFVPTTSPYRPNESRLVKFARDRRLFGAGAMKADSVIFKICACGTIAGHRLQGRSLIAVPGEILWRVEPENEDKSILVVARFKTPPSSTLLDIKTYHL